MRSITRRAHQHAASAPYSSLDLDLSLPRLKLFTGFAVQRSFGALSVVQGLHTKIPSLSRPSPGRIMTPSPFKVTVNTCPCPDVASLNLL